LNLPVHETNTSGKVSEEKKTDWYREAKQAKQNKPERELGSITNFATFAIWLAGHFILE